MTTDLRRVSKRVRQASIVGVGLLNALMVAPVATAAPDGTSLQDEFAGESRPELEGRPALTLEGYVEAYYQWNFARPSPRITNYRGFDNRHNSFTLANVALGGSWDDGNVLGRLVLQVGHTPSTYYGAEPVEPQVDGANASNQDLWKFLQEAHLGYRFDTGLVLLAGLFLSPIGPESMAIHDNWNWSHSNLFFGLPFYHTGVQAALPLSRRWTAQVGVYNGWNSVVDNNAEKSVSAQLRWEELDLVELSLLYFGGVEADEGAAERPWRHLVDGYVTWQALGWLALRLHANGGLEVHPMGTSRWAAGAVYARVELIPQLFLAARGDVFEERGAAGVEPIFWPVSWVASGTGTLDFRPNDHLSVQLEYRRDEAAGEMFFVGGGAGAGEQSAGEPRRGASRDTLTAGLTSWF